MVDGWLLPHLAALLERPLAVLPLPVLAPVGAACFAPVGALQPLGGQYMI